MYSTFACTSTDRRHKSPYVTFRAGIDVAWNPPDILLLGLMLREIPQATSGTDTFRHFSTEGDGAARAEHMDGRCQISLFLCIVHMYI